MKTSTRKVVCAVASLGSQIGILIGVWGHDWTVIGAGFGASLLFNLVGR